MLSLYQKSVLNPSTGLFLNSLLKTSTNTFLLNSKNIINKSCSQNQLRFESTSVKDKELKENVL
jgi:hypothetical protein